jgi:diguanylate cyclase (GGDEF)-like protein/PAS domain S-box-containing protein
MILDFKTLIAVNCIVNGINLLTVFLLWRRFGNRFAGLSSWLASMVAQVAGMLLVLAKGHVPDALSVYAGNAILMSSMLFLLDGFGKFVGLSASWRSWRINALAFAAYMAGYFHFFAVDPSMGMRNVLNCAIIIWIDGQCALLLLRGTAPRLRHVVRPAGLVMAGYVLASGIRAAIILSYPREAEVFRTGLADTVAILGYVSLHICLAIALMATITRRLMDEVLASEEKFAKAFHLAPYALCIARQADGRLVEVNQGFSRIFGYGRDEALGLGLGALLFCPLSGDQGETALDRLATLDGGEGLEVSARRKSGQRLVGRLSCDRLALNGEACVLACLSDDTEESRLKASLQELATRDSLTGLANRRLFYERFGIERLHAERERSRMAVVSLDLDRFKAVNDELGHGAGDAVLQEAARRLTACLRQVDVAARFGGDEFVLLLPGIGGHRDALAVGEKIVAAFRVPFEASGRRLVLSASLGVAVYPDHGRDVEALLARSDAALYEMKRQGRDGCRLAQGA